MRNGRFQARQKSHAVSCNRISFQTRALVQGDDEGDVVQLAAVMCPGVVTRRAGTDGLWITTPCDDRSDIASREDALAAGRSHFLLLLGVLRAWHPGAGQVRDELWAGLCLGAVVDHENNHFVTLGSIICRTKFGGELEAFASAAANGIRQSRHLRSAILMNARPNRDCAEYYMIQEYAELDFEGRDGVAKYLGISVSEQKRFRSSANQLHPDDGGRHATGNGIVPMELERQCDYVAELLRRWIIYQR